MIFSRLAIISILIITFSGCSSGDGGDDGNPPKTNNTGNVDDMSGDTSDSNTENPGNSAAKTIDRSNAAGAAMYALLEIRGSGTLVFLEGRFEGTAAQIDLAGAIVNDEPLSQTEDCPDSGSRSWTYNDNDNSKSVTANDT